MLEESAEAPVATYIGGRDRFGGLPWLPTPLPGSQQLVLLADRSSVRYLAQVATVLFADVATCLRCSGKSVRYQAVDPPIRPDRHQAEGTAV